MIDSKTTPAETPGKIHFIGGGNMASSLIGGLLKQDYSPANLSISDPNPQVRENLQASHGILVLESNAQGSREADLVVLAVKPQHMQSVVSELAETLQQMDAPPVLLSIAAGITTDSIQRWAKIRVPVVRSMPNTPALIGQGASGLYATDNVNPMQRSLAEGILAAVGKTWWLPKEKMLDAVTAVSGSGPAYFFLFMESLQAAGIELGLPEDISRGLALQTAVGAAALAAESAEPLTELRRRVTSPGGTTEAALNHLVNAAVPRHIQAAVKAASLRAEELSREFG